MAEDSRLMQLAGASDFFRLAGMMLRYPTPTLVEGIIDGALLADCQASAATMGLSEEFLAPLEGADFLPSSGALDADEVLRSLRREHMRLFGVPREELVYLYESRYMMEEDGVANDYLMFVNPCCMDVEKTMKATGFAPRRDGEEPVDHVSTELEYVGLLYGKAAAALAAGDADEYQCRLGQVAQFRENHLDRWVGQFLDDVMRESAGTFYGACSRVITSLVEQSI